MKGKYKNNRNEKARQDNNSYLGAEIYRLDYKGKNE